MSLIRWLKGEEPSIIEKVGFMIKNNFDTGAYGEYLTEYLFGNENLAGYSKALHNIYVPYRGKTSEIDVLLIHEKGIFVFESKNYSGWIFGSLEQQQWTQMLNRQTKNRFYNPVKQNATHINALSKYLEFDKQIMKSYIVFSERCELKRVPNNTENYTILKRDRLLKELKNDLASRSEVFSIQEIDSITSRLIPLTNVSDEMKQEHINNIKSAHK